jgi:hypothetical protein
MSVKFGQTLWGEHNLRMFENEALRRRISGPKREK